VPLPLPLAPPQLRFYLHQDAAFNHSGVLAALKQRLAGRPMDVGLPVGEAQYLSDVPITAALERHPLRTNDPAAAALHVIGAVPFASSVLADASGDQSSHEARMNALAEQLERLPAFIERRKPFLLVHCSCSAKQLGVPLMQTLGRGNLIVASCDPYFARDFGKLPQPFAHAYRRGVTIPFYPHSLAHDATPLQRTSPQTPTHETPRATNRSGIMFHGGLGRYDHGLRDGMLELIGRVRKAGGVRVDTRIGEMSRGSNRSAYSRLSYAESGQSYRDASMCLVPAGDVPSSRRLFDVMSAGCVPVLVRSFFRMTADQHDFTTSMPFPLSIDWRAATLWLAPNVRGKSKEACMTESADWLRQWHSARPCELEQARRVARAAFHAHLDSDRNPEGIVWALLREIEQRSKYCDPTLSREKSAFHVNNSVDNPTQCPYNDARSSGKTRLSAVAQRTLDKLVMRRPKS